ncbi:MAG: lamin tail domain-containing protein, partial [Verrucomicrobiota bacterium]
IVINEYAAHTDTITTNESNDWIEFFNTRFTNILLGDWYISDDPAELTKWAIPGTNGAPPLGWVAFDEITGFHNPINTGFGLNKAGEQILLSHLPGAGRDRVADAIKFKGQENGITEGRYVDGDPFLYRLDPTRGASNRLAAASVMIEEVMFHPAPTPMHPADNSHDEFIVLYNSSPIPVTFTNEAGTWRLDGEVDYTFSSNTTLNPGERLVLVSFAPTNPTEVATFLALYGETNGALPVLGPYDGKLSNRGGRLALEKPQNGDLPGEPISWIVMDELIYFDRCPWPVTADGTGLSLQRIDPRVSGNDSANWFPGTPNLSGSALNFPNMNLSIQPNLSGYFVQWTPLAGFDSHLEYSDSLLLPMWNHLTTTNTTNPVATYLDRTATNAPRRYYRVMMEP